MTYRPLIIAHKGFSGKYPESTLLCYEKAAELGCDFGEMDIRSSKDGVLMIKHELKMNDLTNYEGAIYDYTFHELRKMDFGSKFDSKFKGQKIATFQEIIDLLKKYPMKMCVETKDVEWEDIPRYEDKIIDIFRRENLFEKAVINIKNLSFLHKLKKKEPRICTVADLPNTKSEKINKKAIFKELILKNPNIVQYKYNLLTKDIINKLHYLGFPVWAWTVNCRKDMEKLINWGIDAILTDHPDLLKDVLLGS
jgi:glycerophosphoryl diester phosphodiesterase